MRAGKLRHPITIQKLSDTPVRNSRGEWTTPWVTHASVYAGLKHMGGREKWTAQRVVGYPVVTFETRYCDGVTSDMRIIHRNQIYYLSGPPLDPDRRRRSLFISAHLGGEPPFEILSGPSVTDIGGTIATFLWTVSVIAYHRVRHRGQGLGDDDWIVTEFSATPSTSASVYVEAIPCTHEIHEYQVQSCLVGDGSAATDWTPATPDTVDMIRVADISLSNFNAEKMPFPVDSCKVSCTSNHNVYIKTRWKESGGSWTTAPYYSSPASKTPAQFLYNLKLVAEKMYIYETKKRDICLNEGSFGDQHGFSTNADNAIVDQW